jgi:undecaprenyl-diphosphatase
MIASVYFLIAFLLWTVAVATVDVQPIGPEDSRVGFAGLNQWLHQRTGVHMELYVLTDWLSLIPLCFVSGFGFLGLYQWISRRSFWKVDRSILVLGGFYLITGVVFLFFEKCIINYRPVLMDGILEASYPSSTTLLVLCMMPTAKMQLDGRIKNPAARKIVGLAIVAFTIFMVVGRLVSGVHWITDIAGGVLLSAGLVMLYRWACEPYLK